MKAYENNRIYQYKITWNTFFCYSVLCYVFRRYQKRQIASNTQARICPCKMFNNIYRIVVDTMIYRIVVNQEIPKCIYTFFSVFNTSLNIS